ncbi:hypothetical protein ACFQ2D_08380 [Luteimonas composti]|uniref:hypothetical protein n=1 Tax=Luteimonas composti TaxID=398257 RepID=UPI00363859F2
MNAAAHIPTARDVLTQARRCAGLIDVLRAEIEQEIGPREAELIGLADDLAARLYRVFWATPGGGEPSFTGEAVLKLSGLAGRLRATTYAMHEMAVRSAQPGEALHDDPDGLLGWMQCVADDLASEIVAGIEQAIEGNEPPRPRVEVGARNSGAAASQVARLVGSSMDRHGSSLAAA